MTPELRHLRCFVAVAEELSFSAAARALYVSQQSISRAVAQLERQVGAPLFERSTRSVALTAAGEAMLPAARRALAAAEEASAAARAAAEGPRAPRLRADISSGGIETGALIVRRLRRDRPDVAVEQVEHGVPRGLRLLAAQRLDVLLGLATRRPPEVRAEVVRLEPALVGMAAGHPLAAGEAVPVAALAGLDLLLPSDDAAREWNEFVETFCRQAGFAPRRFAGVTHGSVAAAEVVRDERCVVPTMAWTEPPPGLVFRPLVDPTPVLAWSVMWLAGAEERPEVQAFLDAARAVRDERGWSTGSDAPP